MSERIIGWVRGSIGPIGEWSDLSGNRTRRMNAPGAYNDVAVALQSGTAPWPDLCFDHDITRFEGTLGRVMDLKVRSCWIGFRAVIFDWPQSRRFMSYVFEDGLSFGVSCWPLGMVGPSTTDRNGITSETIERVGDLGEISLLSDGRQGWFPTAYGKVFHGAPPEHVNGYSAPHNEPRIHAAAKGF
jgi:hypothetical protein